MKFKIKNSEIYLQFVLAYGLHFLIYRMATAILTSSEGNLFKEFFVGHLFDLSLLSFILLLALGIERLSQNCKVLKIYFGLFYFFIFALNLINYYMLSYFPDGLTSFDILFDYLFDFSLILKMGVLSFSSLSPLLFLLPAVFLFKIPKRLQLGKLEFSSKTLLTALPTLALLALSTFALANTLKDASYPPIETNPLIRMSFNKSKMEKKFERLEAIKNKNLTEKQLKTIQTSTHAKYLSDEFPLWKKDNMQPLAWAKKEGEAYPNIIVFALESMNSFETGIKNYFSPEEIELFKNEKSYTPFLDTLLDKSIVMPNFYAHGNFTIIGQSAILCSVYDPVYAISSPGHSLMRFYSHHQVKCLPEYLSEVGYQNYFFNGYTKEFDNKAQFLPRIKLDQIYCLDEMKDELGVIENEHHWGLRDKTVLKFMASKLDAAPKPFFSKFMSINTHLPYGHKDSPPAGMNDHQYALKLTDAAIKDFFEVSKDKPWFQNTIFIFTADNGQSFTSSKLEEKYPKEEHFNRVPLVIYWPARENQAKVITRVGDHVDIPPTILNLIGLNQTENHFVGQSLFSEQEKIVFQYISFDHFSTVPKKSEEYLENLKDISMSLLLNNKIRPPQK